MKQGKSYYEDLLRKYQNNTCNGEELEALINWAKEESDELSGNLESYWNAIQANDMSKAELFKEILDKAKAIEDAETADKEKAWQPIGQRSVRHMFIRIAAAVLIIIAGFAIWYIFNSEVDPVSSPMVENMAPVNDASPGGNKATLTLSDGSTIILDDKEEGMITKQGDVSILMMEGARLLYDKGSISGEVIYNTITTPRGGQYQLQLSDGSRVWLNAESSLRYPVVFSDTERKVELKGEGYFEVAHVNNKPFYVETSEMNIKVLGTRFNINAYADEQMPKTTLIEGGIEVQASGESLLLKPGQQAVISSGHIMMSRNVNIESVLAWRNGVFYFDKNNISEVMRQLSRWYDVQISSEGNFKGRTFSGQMKRSLNLSQVMKILEYNDINYKIIGKQMIISP